MIFKPYPYQVHSEQHILDNPACGLFLEMGLGKTCITLTALDKLLHDTCEVRKVLIIAPKRVAEHTWATEARKWDHLQHLRLSLVLGTETERLAALRRKADIWVINRENVAWLVSHYATAFPFDAVVIDELSSFKSAKSVRFKALRQVRPLVRRVIGLTGTPAPNSLLDLWPQIYLLDQGQRLETTLTGYRAKYFDKSTDGIGGVGHGYDLKTANEEFLGKGFYQNKIFEKISDICISMKSADYLDLPGRFNRTVAVQLCPKALAQYYEFEKTQVLALQDVEDISAVNAAALTTKLLQYANGAVYDAEKNWHEIHQEKLEALEEILDAANGKPVMVFYAFKHDLERMHRYLKGYKPGELKTAGDIERWNRGEIPVMFAHPASAGHGLNLQAGGHIIVWFGQTYSLELVKQANARLDRQGQTETVIIHSLIALGTIDEDVVGAIERKDNLQEALIAAVKARIDKYVKN